MGLRQLKPCFEGQTNLKPSGLEGEEYRAMQPAKRELLILKEQKPTKPSLGGTGMIWISLMLITSLHILRAFGYSLVPLYHINQEFWGMLRF